MAHSGTWEKLLADVAGGNGRIVLIEGGAGSGKTRSIGQLLSAARRGNGHILLARCGADERDVLLSTVQQLFDTAPGDEPTGCQPSPRAAAVGEHGAERGRIFRDYFRAVKTLADRASAERGLLAIAIDDAHVADQASLEWLGYLARRIDRLPVLLAITWLEDEQAAGHAVATMAAHLAAIRMKLTPFSPNVARRLANRILNRTPDDGFVELLQDLTGGNPQLTVELLRSLAARSVRPTVAYASTMETVFGEVLSNVMTDRLRRQPVKVT